MVCNIETHVRLMTALPEYITKGEILRGNQNYLPRPKLADHRQRVLSTKILDAILKMHCSNRN